MPSPVSNLIVGVNQTALRQWLRQKELKHSASNIDALAAVIEKQIDKGTLSQEELIEGVREIEEYGGKRIYLRRMVQKAILADADGFERRVADLGYTISDKPKGSIKNPPRSRLNYICRTSNEVRAKFSETHTFITPDKRNVTWRTEQKTVFVVLSADPKSGLVKIFIDPPGDEHLHLDSRGYISDGAYVNYYMERTAELFGEFEPFPLFKPTERLLKVKPPLYVPRSNAGLDSDNVNYSFRTRAGSDVRASRAYKAALEDDEIPCLIEDVRGDWIQSASGGKLMRDVWMQIKPADSMLKVRAHCLASEVEYAISTITKI